MSRLRKSARGRDCTLRLFPYCSHDPETTVLAHINSDSKGLGLKSEDWFAVYACHTCHDIIDGRVRTHLLKPDIDRAVLMALHRTWKIMIEEELIHVV